MTYHRRACKVYGNSIDMVLLIPRVGHKEIGQLFLSKSSELSKMQGGRTGKSMASVNSMHSCKLKISLCMHAFVSCQCICQNLHDAGIQFMLAYKKNNL